MQQKNVKSNELSKMLSTFFLSLKLEKILNISTVMLNFDKLKSEQIS